MLVVMEMVLLVELIMEVDEVELLKLEKPLLVRQLVVLVVMVKIMLWE